MLEVKRAEQTKKERKLEREVMLEAPVDEVWKALTDAKELKKWFPLEARVRPGASGKIFLSWGPGCEGEAEIVAWEPGKRFAWKEQFALIEWTLEQRGTKTLLRLVQRGFLGGGDWENEWFDSTSYGWTFMLLSLEVALERHRGIDRKVAWPRLQVSVTREEAYSKLMRPDGIFTADAGATLKSGEAYSLATTTGESFTGQVQFVRVPRGFCLTVRELNDALLWLTIEGVPDKIEVQLWLSTFGLDQAKVDAFSERWQKRLREIFAA